MPKHERPAVKRAKDALDNLFGDRSVNAEQTLMDLIDLKDEIEVMVDALREDLKK